MKIFSDETKAVAQQKGENAKKAFRSWSDFKAWLEVTDTALDEVI